MNPYESKPVSPMSDRPPNPAPSQPIGPILVAFLYIAAGLIGILSIFVPAVRAATMPRFGWIGLILCFNPLIFLLPWFRNPTRNALLATAWMSFALSAINAVQLIFKGTVLIVTNEFHDRLHSSWLWSVFSFFAIGLYLLGLALSHKNRDSETP
jgi:hypothetical protein